MSVSGRLVVVSGATSASGLAATRELVAAGARVVAVGRSPEKLAELAASVKAGPGVADLGPAGSVRTEECDLTDERGHDGRRHGREAGRGIEEHPHRGAHARRRRRRR